MYAFLCADRLPVTKKAASCPKYEADLRAAFRRYYPAAAVQNRDSYGVVYYFHRRPHGIDADNLCKPVFDALKSEAYEDDKCLRLIQAGIHDLTAKGFHVLNLTSVPDNVLSDLLRALNTSDHILYVEVGELDYEMFEFGYER